VAGTDSEQIYIQPNISSHSTPNSHRRQKTPARRIVTPQTPHVMVRRSARQQHNLSQYMMAETIIQANHFSPFQHNQKLNTQENQAKIGKSISCQKWQMQ
jgi:hypothetical protein